MIKHALAVAALVAAGCARADPSDYAIAGAVADVVSTEVALANPDVTELNPLGYGTIVAKVLIYKWIETRPLAEQPALFNAYGSITFGAAANNLCMFSGAAFPLCLAIGATVGVFLYNHNEDTFTSADAVVDGMRPSTTN